MLASFVMHTVGLRHNKKSAADVHLPPKDYGERRRGWFPLSQCLAQTIYKNVFCEVNNNYNPSAGNYTRCKKIFLHIPVCANMKKFLRNCRKTIAFYCVLFYNILVGICEVQGMCRRYFYRAVSGISAAW